MANYTQGGAGGILKLHSESLRLLRGGVSGGERESLCVGVVVIETEDSDGGGLSGQAFVVVVV